jgi:hypothetical protein
MWFSLGHGSPPRAMTMRNSNSISHMALGDACIHVFDLESTHFQSL